MANSKKKKYLLLGLVLCFVGALASGLYAIKANTYVLADAGTESADEFIITDTKDEVLATYQYARLNDTECSVKITNKSEATKAVIPSKVEIDGLQYRVTEVAANGFASSTKLLRVSLPSSIKKINNMAFANCTNLERISIANVKEIGNSVFYKCTNLRNIVIPKSVEKVGTTILRGNTTEVHIRAAEIGENWSSTWNSGNNNQNVQFNSTYSAPLELETVYTVQATFSPRTTDPTMIGYVVAGGQPRTDEFYIQENSNIFIPNMYNDEIILGISESAFEETVFDQLVIEYSAESIWIGSLAFSGVNCNNITINRNVEFYDYNFDAPSDNIFALSNFNSIILPDTISEFPVSMFYDCSSLSNIYFNTPIYKEKRDSVLAFIDKFKADSTEGVIHLTDNANFNKICESAFDGTTSIKELHIYSNIEEFGPTVFSNWTSDQKVYIHNDNKNFTKNWHMDALVGMASENVIYDAAYYNISFNCNGGTSNLDDKEVKLNAPVGELPVPEYAYKVFTGWYDASNNKYDENTVYTEESDITLAAQWRNYEYNVKYDSNRPNEAINPVVGNMEESVHEYSVSSDLSENLFAIAGWHFIGWNTDKDGNGKAFADKAAITDLNEIDGETTTLYAQWVRNEYIISYNSNEPATASNSVTGNMLVSTHTHGIAQTLTANDYALLGWHFTGWNTKDDGSGIVLSDKQSSTYLTFDHNSTVELYAQWEQNNYYVHYEPNQPETYYNVVGTMSDSEHLYDVITQLKMNEFSLNGWTFISWNTKADGTGTDYCDEEAVSDLVARDSGVIILFAKWDKNYYKITYNLNGGENPNTESTFTVDNEIVFEAPIKNGFIGSWNPPSIRRGTYTDFTVEAKYQERKLYVDFYLNDGTDYIFRHLEINHGDSITSLDAATRYDYYFLGWKYNDEYIVSLENIQTDMEIYAEWIPIVGQKYSLGAYDTEFTVSSENSIIELPNTYIKTNSTKVIVTSNVKKLIIHSDVYLRYNFYLEFEQRNQEIDIILLNFNLHAPYWRSAIGPAGTNLQYQWSDLTFDLNVNLYAYNCKISVQLGIEAIICSKITLNTPIEIEGGSGGRYIGYSSSAIRANTVIINSGYVTLYGGNGYESGGSPAVSGTVDYTKDLYEETAEIIAGEDDNG